VKIPSRGTPEFWRLYFALPAETRTLARKTYELWKLNAFHPSLHFKCIGQPNWSVRIGAHCRAIGRFTENAFLWEWIGSHADYDKRF
jgi:hypothetical protein